MGGRERVLGSRRSSWSFFDFFLVASRTQSGVSNFFLFFFLGWEGVWKLIMGRAPCCEKVGLRRGRWTAEEDEKLINYIKQNGEGSWRSLPKNAGIYIYRCFFFCMLEFLELLAPSCRQSNHVLPLLDFCRHPLRKKTRHTKLKSHRINQNSRQQRTMLATILLDLLLSIQMPFQSLGFNPTTGQGSYIYTKNYISMLQYFIADRCQSQPLVLVFYCSFFSLAFSFHAHLCSSWLSNQDFILAWDFVGLLRCGKSCRLRWINYLRADLKRGNFTREEEETIINLHRSVGNK